VRTNLPSADLQVIRAKLGVAVQGVYLSRSKYGLPAQQTTTLPAAAASAHHSTINPIARLLPTFTSLSMTFGCKVTTHTTAFVGMHLGWLPFPSMIINVSWQQDFVSD
jgi:hypothetical protein